MAIAPVWDFTIEQGSTFTARVTIKKNGNPVDLTGASAKFQARESIQSTSTLLEWNSGAELTLGGEDGTVDFLVDAEVTAEYSFRSAVADLRITLSDGFVLPRLYASPKVKKQVTRDD